MPRRIETCLQEIIQAPSAAARPIYEVAVPKSGLLGAPQAIDSIRHKTGCEAAAALARGEVGRLWMSEFGVLQAE
jgi:hypothetical protein